MERYGTEDLAVNIFEFVILRADLEELPEAERLARIAEIRKAEAHLPPLEDGRLSLEAQIDGSGYQRRGWRGKTGSNVGKQYAVP